MTSLRRARPVLLLATGLLLAGCTGVAEGSASPAAGSTSAPDSSSSSASAEPSDDDAEDLSAGLLPADAFGPGAVVTELTEAQLQQGASVVPDSADLTITPESCAAAVQDSQPGVEDLDGFAAQSIESGGTSTVELLTTGGPDEDPVGTLSDVATTCPQATVSSPELGSVTLTFTALPVPALGDGSAAVAYTTTVPGPGGALLTIPAAIGLVQDGDRLLTLVSLGTTAPVDPAQFAALLQQAFDHQAGALD